MKKKIAGLMLTTIELLSSCALDTFDVGDLMHLGIRSTKFQELSSDTVSRTAYKAIEDLSPYFMKSDLNSNYVLSPASYLLATAGLASVSDNFNNDAFGFSSDSLEDTKELLTAWNFEYRNSDRGDYCYFRSAVLHQQVGDTYVFDEEKRSECKTNHISTMVSSEKDYRKQAQNFFHNEIGLTIDVPDAKNKNGVNTYGGLVMKDYVANGLRNSKNSFTTYENKNIDVDSYAFGSTNFPTYVKYYKASNYQVFKLGINDTSLLIVLPDEGVNLNTIDVSEAYQNYIKEADYVPSRGYVPFYHIRTESEDLTSALSNKLTGEEVFYSKLLKEDVKNDLALSVVLQSSDFEFNKYGVSGQSITVEAMAGSAAPGERPTPIELYINRPFYAISLKDNFPVFVSAVYDPSQSA